MKENSAPLTRSTIGFGIALAICSLVNAVLVILKERNPAVVAVMKKMTGHHWITHALVIVGLFFVLGWLFSRIPSLHRPGVPAGRMLAILAIGALVGGGAIVAFYLIAD